MLERLTDTIERKRRTWWFGKWASIAYIAALLLFALYVQIPEDTFWKTATLVLLAICFVIGLILAFLQNSKPALVAIDCDREALDQEKYREILMRWQHSSRME